MFGLGMWEIAIVFVVILLVVKPEDIPDLMRSCSKGGRKLKNMSAEFTSMFDEVSEEVSMKKIIGDDGKEYPAFDISDKKSND